MTLTLNGTEQAFLEDICTHPEDDGLRLIYADWLEEHGREQRARYIRVQIEIARLWEGVEYDQARAADLVSQETDLLTQENFWEWFGPTLAVVWPERPPLRLYHGEFAQVGAWGGPTSGLNWNLSLRRGFLDGIGLTGTELRRHGKKLVRCGQPLAEIQLQDAEPSEDNHLTPSIWYWQYCRCWLAERAESRGSDGWTCGVRSHLPSELFKLLNAGRQRGGDLHLRSYPSKQSAEQDLSNACLRWCRQPTPHPAY
jgi:uncharacterized protein (TIGR02996 family)